MVFCACECVCFLFALCVSVCFFRFRMYSFVFYVCVGLEVGEWDLGLRLGDLRFGIRDVGCVMSAMIEASAVQLDFDIGEVWGTPSKVPWSLFLTTRGAEESFDRFGTIFAPVEYSTLTRDTLKLQKPDCTGQPTFLNNLVFAFESRASNNYFWCHYLGPHWFCTYNFLWKCFAALPGNFWTHVLYTSRFHVVSRVCFLCVLCVCESVNTRFWHTWNGLSRHHLFSTSVVK